LHVDDDPDTLNITKMSLELIDSAFEVESAPSVNELNKMLDGASYDCIISDYMMPDMDGLVLAKKIRARSDVPFIVYTGQGSEEVAEAAFEVGVDDYVRKETDLSHYKLLARRVRTLVEKRWGEDLMARVPELSLDSIAIVQDGVIVYANQATADLMGVGSPEALIGRDGLAFVGDEDRGAISAQHDMRMRGALDHQLHELTIERTDGKPRTIEVSASSIVYRGKPAALAFTRDITDRKRAEEALSASEERWRSLFELAPDGFITVNLKGFVTSINDAFAKITGFSDEEIVGKHFTKLGTFRLVKEIPKFLKMFGAALQGNPIPPVEFAYNRRDGSIGWGESHARLIETETGKKEIIAILREVSERKQAVAVLRESEERFKNLVEMAPDGIITIDLRGFLTSVNRSFTALTGFSEEEIVGKHLSRLQTIRLRDIPNFLRMFKAMLSGEELETIQFVYNRKDGSTGFGEGRFTIEHKDGKKVGLLGILRDVTDHKRLEGRLEALHRHSSQLATADSHEKIAVQTIKTIDEVLGYNVCGFSIHVDGALTGFLSNDFPVNGPNSLPLDGPGVTVRAFKTGETQLVPDTRLDVDYVGADSGESELRSELVVPVKISGEPVAVINIESPEVNAFTEEDRKIVEILAEHVASAMTRLRVREELRASEERYRSLFESTIEGIIISDPQGKITTANQSAASILGFQRPDDLVGHSTVEFFTDPGHRESILNDLRIRGHISGYEIIAQRIDGVQRNIQMSATIHRDADGKVVKTEGIFRDVTAQTETEEELRRSEEKYRRLIEISPSAIVTMDFYGYITSINQATLALTGYRVDELINKHFTELDFLHDRDIPRLETLFKEVQNELINRPFEIQFYHKNGETLWGECYTGYFEERGEVAGIQLVVLDITERKRMAEELQEREEFFRGIVETSFDFIFTLDTYQRITYISPTLSKMIDFDLEKLIGQNVMDYVPEPVKPDILDVFERTMRGERIMGLQGEWPNRDGSILHVELNTSPLFRDGLVVGVQATARNITDRMRYEEELREHSVRLGELVEKRTSELLDAERMAAIGKVSAMVAHDLRGPLIVINNAVALARKKPDRTDDVFEMIERNAERAVDILEELRGQTRDEPLSLRVVNIGMMFRKAVKDAELPERIRVDIDVDERLETSMDEVKLTRVIDNMIRNAIDAMPEGGVLTLGADSKESKTFIRVSDTGAGIPENVMDRLFEPFFTTKSKGMGLGLASSKRIVEAHGGALSVESEAGVGSTFTIELPGL